MKKNIKPDNVKYWYEYEERNSYTVHRIINKHKNKTNIGQVW